MFANNHPHMGNRTSGRAESFHSGLKRALGNQTTSKLTLTVKRMHTYYENKVNHQMNEIEHHEMKRRDRIGQQDNKALHIDSISFNLSRKYRFKKLKFKVVKFAMDKIRSNTLDTLHPGFVSSGADCRCWDRIHYKLPCSCNIAASPAVLPLCIVDKRWRLYPNEEGVYYEHCLSTYAYKSLLPRLWRRRCSFCWDSFGW